LLADGLSLPLAHRISSNASCNACARSHLTEQECTASFGMIAIDMSAHCLAGHAHVLSPSWCQAREEADRLGRVRPTELPTWNTAVSNPSG